MGMASHVGMFVCMSVCSVFARVLLYLLVGTFCRLLLSERVLISLELGFEIRFRI